MSNKDTHLSKTLSWLLRHGATKECLNISSDGYISVREILQHRSLRGRYNKEDIERVVATNSKQRFKLRFNNSTNILEIKANQGHSIQISDDDLIQILEPHYETVVHGTYYKYWSKIKIEGLSRMKRKHIHFAKGTLNDRNVISGLRQDVEIYIFIDLTKALADGILFFESENGVILTKGNNIGFLEPKYFWKVIDRRTGASLL
ncbi:tRNA 2'-phosphotransferase 1 [Melitaea cinxia]|uniref:tRNA 2'-phosphotransferase 1 n=1 Tax=Melitaea cinxia TaxID=113334 RepID=UPI001E273934|nr:tRNA 2'-phosphotransferase 1 [Melitaea cinxia]